jgi:tetratricopeptide (TPR) repeat protein
VTLLRHAASGLPVALLAACVATAAAAEAPRQPLAQVNQALQAGEADKALALLNSLPPSNETLAETNNLECRVLFTVELWDRAVETCQKAVNADNQNSDYHLWLGRALGRKAGQANFLSAFSLGKRVRVEFEEAVRLNPRNGDALADLGEFYREAPGVVGGGLDKAEGVATQLDSVDPARAHELRGRVAEERKDDGTAEREYKQAIAVSPRPAFRWTTLADFYRRRQRWADMDSAIKSCISATEHDKHAGVPLFDGASLLIDANRDLPQAAKMLEDYLAGQAKTEEAPAFAAYTLLARIKLKLGDPAGAKRDQAAALALASEYKPARDLKMQ